MLEGEAQVAEDEGRGIESVHFQNSYLVLDPADEVLMVFKDLAERESQGTKWSVDATPKASVSSGPKEHRLTIKAMNTTMAAVGTKLGRIMNKREETKLPNHTDLSGVILHEVHMSVFKRQFVLRIVNPRLRTTLYVAFQHRLEFEEWYQRVSHVVYRYTDGHTSLYRTLTISFDCSQFSSKFDHLIEVYIDQQPFAFVSLPSKTSVRQRAVTLSRLSPFEREISIFLVKRKAASLACVKIPLMTTDDELLDAVYLAPQGKPEALIKIRCKPMFLVVPNEHHSTLFHNFLMTHLNIFLIIPQELQKKVTKAVVGLCITNNVAETLLIRILRDEVERTQAEHEDRWMTDLFRRDSLATRSFEAYLSLVGQDYLLDTFKDTMTSIYAGKKTKLADIVSSLWNDMCASVERMPASILRIFNVVSSMFSTMTLPPHISLLECMSKFFRNALFLRFFFPSILCSTAQYGFETFVCEEGVYNLKHAVSILRNLVFGQTKTEGEFAGFNKFTTAAQEDVQRYNTVLFQKITQDTHESVVAEVPHVIAADLPEYVSSSLSYIHSVLVVPQHLGLLSSALPQADYSVLKQALDSFTDVLMKEMIAVKRREARYTGTILEDTRNRMCSSVSETVFLVTDEVKGLSATTIESILSKLDEIHDKSALRDSISSSSTPIRPFATDFPPVSGLCTFDELDDCNMEGDIDELRQLVCTLQREKIELEADKSNLSTSVKSLQEEKAALEEERDNLLQRVQKLETQLRRQPQATVHHPYTEEIIHPCSVNDESYLV